MLVLTYFTNANVTTQVTSDIALGGVLHQKYDGELRVYM